jgi:plastocyanin
MGERGIMFAATTGIASALVLAAAGIAGAGTIQGRVILHDNAHSDNIVVYLEQVPGSYAPAGKRPELIHRNLAFFPVVLPVLRNSTVDFPNTDPVFHSAFSTSPSNPFELGVYGQGREKFVQFNNPGVVDISCHIHPFMRAAIVVLENPFFAVTDERGRYTIHQIPPGRYTLRAWSSAKTQAVAQPVSVNRDGTVVIDLTLSR